MRHRLTAGMFAGALSIAILGVGAVRAQSVADPLLQGRVLVTSDGTVYVYKDGSKYQVQPARLTDDQIGAINDSGQSILRVDQLFTQTPPPPVAQSDPEQPTPTATPVPAPKPGDVLYQADWSQGMAGWSGTPDWQTAAGMLVDDGKGSLGTVWAPFRAPVNDYAVESEIQIPQGSTAGSIFQLGVILRGADANNHGFYMGGLSAFTGPITVDIRTICVTCPNGTSDNVIVTKPFTPGRDWHKYRLEAKGNHLRLLLDGNVILESDDNGYLSGDRMGLFESNQQANVKSFRVVAL